jgi:hypothetical protein
MCSKPYSVQLTAVQKVLTTATAAQGTAGPTTSATATQSTPIKFKLRLESGIYLSSNGHMSVLLYSYDDDSSRNNKVTNVNYSLPGSSLRSENTFNQFIVSNNPKKLIFR